MSKNSKQPAVGKTTNRLYSVTGTTVALNDGQTRDITLVAVVNTEVVEDAIRTTRTREEGNKTYFINVVERVNFTKTTLHIGLAVVSPVDKEFTARYNELKDSAHRANNEKAAAMLISNGSSLVTPERGLEIAKGKAMKRKTCIATIVTDAPFFGKTMVQTMLDVKMKQICEDPNRFIRVTPIDAVTKELAAQNKLTPSDPNANAKAKDTVKSGKFTVHEVEHA